ncbi:MAG: hypothetical protein AAF752_16285 [Bacteroidota bacterium]
MEAIYEFIDPRTQRVFFVGRMSLEGNPVREGVLDAKTQEQLNAYITELHDHGTNPTSNILEICNPSEAPARLTHWLSLRKDSDPELLHG